MSRTFEGCNRCPVWRVANESAESRHVHRGSVALLQLAFRQVEGRGGVAIVAVVVMENDSESRESDNTRLQMACPAQCHIKVHVVRALVSDVKRLRLMAMNMDRVTDSQFRWQSVNKKLTSRPVCSAQLVRCSRSQGI